MILCAIADRFGWTFTEIGELTGPQLAAIGRYLSSQKPKE